jgi:class 3 adenylate cyclase
VTEVPRTQYTSLGEDRIAYQVFGEGPVDLVFASSSGECVDIRWEVPGYGDLLRRLASLSRVIMFDRRGTGSSDPASGDSLPSWERWADETQVVMDAVGSERAVIFGHVEAGATAILFAGVHADRTRALILFHAAARYLVGPDYPWGATPETLDRIADSIADGWGTDRMPAFSPDATRDPGFHRWLLRMQRLTMSPKEAAVHFRWLFHTDVREMLPSVRTPTLVLHREGYKWTSPEHGRYIADRVPEARFAMVPGSDASWFTAPTAETMHYIGEFLTGLSAVVEPDRALAAILFTDIVGSTERAAALGDREWRNLIGTHDLVVRTIVEQHRGRLIRTTGDGMLATFDGPGRAIHCAAALRDALRALGLEIRAGLHTGEIEFTGNDIAGIGVHIAARVLDKASAGQLLTSAAVPMLVAGSGIEFDDRGEHDLKGVPGTWRLFSVLD